MFAVERIKIIKNYLLKNLQVDVHVLSEMLEVSEVTIRRDLEKLENEGFLTRTHGGAVFNSSVAAAIPEADAPVPSEIAEIAEFAMHVIYDNDVLLLGSGIISTELAKLFETRSGLTVLTNNMDAGAIISRQLQNKAIILGGEVMSDSSTLCGPLTLNNLRRYHVQKFFIEVDSISENLSVSITNQDKADFIEAALEFCDEKIILCPSRSFNQNSFYRLSDISIADKIITNPDLPDSIKSKIFTKHIQLFTSILAFEGKV